MSKYAVKITETSARTVIVEADNFLAAQAKVTNPYDCGDIILDAEDFFDKEFGASETFGEKPIDENDNRLQYYPMIKSKNTKFQYLYRDADNYKQWNEVILAGEITDEQTETIVDACDGEYFIPEQVGLPIERPDDNITEADHCFCELYHTYINLTDDEPTVDITVDELVKRFEEAKKNGWDAAKYGVEV